MFDLRTSTPISNEPEVGPFDTPVWTQHKARLIQLYLRFFVYITHHGTYIDGFAGPQEEDKPEMWAAKLVLESEPWRLRNFFLFEKDKDKVRQLEHLKAGQRARRRKDPQRRIEILPGDFNKRIHEILTPELIKESEATFCLLDQRTFECSWSSVEAIARHKKKGLKIEIFYFLANWWLDRAFAGVTTEAGARQVESWWGRQNWREVQAMSREARVDAFVHRLRDLGYQSVKPWKIYDQQGSDSVMYYMIHATDHPEGPLQMARAYKQAVRDPSTDAEQLKLLLNHGGLKPPTP